MDRWDGPGLEVRPSGAKGDLGMGVGLVGW